MRFIFNSCPCCYLSSRKSIEVVQKASSMDNEKIKCRNCGWIGTWAEMSKFIFENKGDKK